MEEMGKDNGNHGWGRDLHPLQSHRRQQNLEIPGSGHLPAPSRLVRGGGRCQAPHPGPCCKTINLTCMINKKS